MCRWLLWVGAGLGLIFVFGAEVSTLEAAVSEVASEPVPAVGAKGVSTDAVLQWTAGQGVQAQEGHFVYVGTDKAEVADAFYRNHPNVEVLVASEPTAVLSDLAANTTYYWRVDQVNEAAGSGLCRGAVWRFTTGQARANNLFKDAFDTARDFLTQGMGESGWDGFVGQGQGQTVDRIESVDGQIVLESTNGRYDGGKPLGPLLYKTVAADFKATVHVTDYQMISFNNGGIMARVADPADAGQGEDWISVDYFPLYGGIYARMSDDNRRTENANSGQGRSADKYLQLERVGNLFFLRHSVDGVTWQELSCSPITRSDLVNVPLQVGLFHATYSGNRGQIAFDDFSLEWGEQIKTARIYAPEDEAVDTPSSVTLSWVPGSDAEFHDVYFGTSLDGVQSAQPGDEQYKGRQPVGEIEYQVSRLENDTTYYWRVDEVRGDEIPPGALWCFTTFDRGLADFEDVTTTDALRSDWKAGAMASVSLSKTESYSGAQSLALAYQAGSTLTEYTFSQPQNWMDSAYGFRYLSVVFKGDPRNGPGRLAMSFEDGDWLASRSVVTYDGAPTVLTSSGWIRWDIDLQRLVAANPAFRLSQVSKMGLAIEQAQGPGTLYVDEIVISGPRLANTDATWPKWIHPEQSVKVVPFDQVTVTGGLWKERMEVNRRVSLPHVWGRCEDSIKGNGDPSKRLDNFRKAAGQMPGAFTGTYFNDSDVYKIIQGTAYSLQNHPDAELEAYTDKVIDAIAGAQWEDGYLYTFYSLPHKPERRWTNIGSMHELYCAGHLFEGAVAYYEATGKRKLLDVALKFADLICQTFGPGKKINPPGHQEIELALMKLYDLTGNPQYMATAKFFIDQRGRSKGRGSYGTYSQDHIPFVEQETGVGHSVRAGYLYCGAMDVVSVNHDEAYANALFRVWDNVVNAKTYLTGGIGQPGGPEGFANDYELANSCYAETCSGIAFSMWNHRLHQMTGQSKYLDLVERTLLNNMLSSLSHEGDKHTYTNPLTTHGRSRWEWPGHDCACCPSNLVRVIASIGGTLYTHSDDTINVNMYMQGRGQISLPDHDVTLTQATQYPWNGDIWIKVQPEKTGDFKIKLRIPGWARNVPMPGNLYKYLNERHDPVTLAVNGQPVVIDMQNGYATLDRTWKAGDEIHLVLPMSVRRVIAHPRATADAGLVAIERGPMVYCAEFKDNDFDVSNLKVPDDLHFKATFDTDFLGGAVTLTSGKDPKLRLIPYYLYANRGEGWMRVWMPR